MTDPLCEEIRELASEVALGIASGEDRARVLEHNASCSECRQFLHELTLAADELLLMAPSAEPPVGFETKVLARFGVSKSRRRTQMLAAAAAVVGLIAGATGILWVTSDERETAARYGAALAEAEGSYFGVYPIHGPHDSDMGDLFAYAGERSWLFVVFHEAPQAGLYRVAARMDDGEVVRIAKARMTGDEITWGDDIELELKHVRSIRVVDPEGAIFHSPFRH